jgi:plasmid stability protein
MASITVRDIPERTRKELAARAARSGRSMQEYLRLRLIELGDEVDPAELMERVRRRKERTGARLSTEDILAAKDADRR